MDTSDVNERLRANRDKLKKLGVVKMENFAECLVKKLVDNEFCRVDIETTTLNRRLEKIIATSMQDEWNKKLEITPLSLKIYQQRGSGAFELISDSPIEEYWYVIHFMTKK